MGAIDVIWLMDGTSSPTWELGRAVSVRAEVGALAAGVAGLAKSSQAEAVLFWDASLVSPDQGLLQELLASPSDCWHAGLILGLRGLPGIIDFISPTWMLACDPSSKIEATSWRLSLRACLVRMEVLRQLGGPSPEFQTLEGAALEMGHRWIRRGALMRHFPRLLPAPRSPLPAPSSQPLPFEDELRFAYYRFGRKWAAWALFRALMTGYTNLRTALSSWHKVMSSLRPAEPAPLRPAPLSTLNSRPHSPLSTLNSQFPTPLPTLNPQPSTINHQLPTPLSTLHSPLSTGVSVLIPTVDRYPYLRTLLAQLRQQSVPPLEIIIIDQTAPERRQENLYQEFGDLPLKMIFQDQPGQCTSRNAGLQVACGDYILFIDDDDEIKPDLIECHLRTLNAFDAEVSSGVADEVGAGPLPADFLLLRASDVFPTNNTMIRRQVLRRSGLFDLAYNRRQRADGDLGMRVCLSGALMVLNPAISVLHHHAPSGGLRKHKARTVTYARSRNSVFKTALVSASEIYLAQRYFSKEHAREILWQSLLGTASIRGGLCKKLLKVLISMFLLPRSLLRLKRHTQEAREMAEKFPQIPGLDGSQKPERLGHKTPLGIR